MDIKDTNTQAKMLKKTPPRVHAAFDSLKDAAQRAGREHDPRKLRAIHKEIRERIHKLEICYTFDGISVEIARMLGDNGLPRFFQAVAQFPGDMKADNFQLYSRWHRQDFNTDILRGIITSKGKNRDGDKLDKEYSNKYPAGYNGEENLVCGQW